MTFDKNSVYNFYQKVFILEQHIIQNSAKMSASHALAEVYLLLMIRNLMNHFENSIKTAGISIGFIANSVEVCYYIL